MVFSMDQGSYSLGPLYLDRNIAGTRLTLSASAAAIFERAGGEAEGSKSTMKLTYPLWSLSRKWGAAFQFGHKHAVTRIFRGTMLRTYDAPETPEQDDIPHEYRENNLSIETSLTRSFGSQILQRLTIGHDFDITRSRVRDTFQASEIVRAAFVRDVLPRSERASAAFLRYRMFTPRYTAYRDIKTYDLSEDIQLGPDVTITVAPVLELLGSDTNHLRINASASHTTDIHADGYLRLFASATGRLQKGDWIDNRVESSVRLVTPKIAGTVRFASFLGISAYIDETQNRFFTLGGDTGLRGYNIGEFLGQVLVRGNAEVRSSPVSYGFLRFGGVAFWDVGHAADKFGDLHLHHDIGIGLRTLVPQSGPVIYRFDWAFPLQGNNRGWPGRFTAGVEQVF